MCICECMRVFLCVHLCVYLCFHADSVFMYVFVCVCIFMCVFPSMAYASVASLQNICQIFLPMANVMKNTLKKNTH